MAELFRIIGKNDIHFDAGATSNYLFTQDKPPRKLSTILTRREVLSLLPRLPLGVRPMALKQGLSVITMEFNIHGVDDADMEAKEHALIETLVETDLFFSNGGSLGTKAELQVKSDGASEVSFKSVFYGVVDELGARDVLGAIIKTHSMYGLRLTLYCEPHWRPSTFNHLFNGGFEFWDVVQYGGAGTDTEPDGWADREHVNITGTNNREATPADVQQGKYSLEIDVTNSTGAGQYKGVRQDLISRLIPGVTYTLLAWVKNAAITNGVVLVSASLDVGETVHALNSGAANTEYTLYSATFSPDANDGFLYIQAVIYSTGAGCSGTAYIDGMMVVRGTVVPDDFIEWHPNPGIRIGPNLPSNAGFEEWHAGTADSQPDCWADHEFQAANLTGEVNNREDIEVLQGCYALEVIVTGSTGAGQKGVYQDILSRLTVDTEYILIGWVKNEAITNGAVVLAARGDNSGWRYALNSGLANDDYTRYAVTFTPNGADTYLRIYAILAIAGAGGSGTVYFDKIMAIRTSVYNGHSFAPEEWTGCGYVYNHYDGDCGHVNYLGLADLTGDVEARLQLIMDYSVGNVRDTVIVARRTRASPCALIHVREAEVNSTSANWGAAADGTCSNGNKITNSAAGNGSVAWYIATPPDDLLGRFRVIARTKTDDIVNTQLRARARHSASGAWQYNKWKRLPLVNQWDYIDLGTIEFDLRLRDNVVPNRLDIQVDYEKDAADLVELDFIMLVPEDESILMVDAYPGVGSGQLVYSETEDFLYSGVEISAQYYTPLTVHGLLELMPEEQARLYFAEHGSDGRWRIHHETANWYMIMGIKYLRQYISPLE